MKEQWNNFKEENERLSQEVERLQKEIAVFASHSVECVQKGIAKEVNEIVGE